MVDASGNCKTDDDAHCAAASPDLSSCQTCSYEYYRTLPLQCCLKGYEGATCSPFADLGLCVGSSTESGTRKCVLCSLSYLMVSGTCVY